MNNTQKSTWKTFSLINADIHHHKLHDDDIFYPSIPVIFSHSYKRLLLLQAIIKTIKAAHVDKNLNEELQLKF